MSGLRLDAVPSRASQKTVPQPIRVWLHELGAGDDVMQRLLEGDVATATVLLGGHDGIPRGLFRALGDWFVSRDLLGAAALAYLLGDCHPHLIRVVRELLRRGRFDEAATVAARAGEPLSAEDVAMYAQLAHERRQFVDARAAAILSRSAHESDHSPN